MKKILFAALALATGLGFTACSSEPTADIAVYGWYKWDPEQVSEDQMVILARELARRIESELEYPGQIKVHVLRETKVVEYAK